MEIVKEGKIGKKDGLNFMYITCDKCGAILKITASDLKNTSTTNIFPNSYTYKCLCCEKINQLPAKRLTHDIKLDHVYIHMAEYA